MRGIVRPESVVCDAGSVSSPLYRRLTSVVTPDPYHTSVLTGEGPRGVLSGVTGFR